MQCNTELNCDEYIIGMQTMLSDNS